jgi:hypothetical protein
MAAKDKPIPRGKRPDGTLMSQAERDAEWDAMVAQGIRKGFGPSGPSRRGSALQAFERQQRATAHSSTRTPGHGAAAQLAENLAARHSTASHRAKIAERLFPPRARPKNKAPERP